MEEFYMIYVDNLPSHQTNPKYGQYTKYLTITAQNGQGHSKQGKYKKVLLPRGAYRDRTIKYNVVF